MGKVFKALGVLPTDEVLDLSVSELQTGYMGQAGPKTREMLEKVCILPRLTVVGRGVGADSHLIVPVHFRPDTIGQRWCSLY